MSKKIEACEKRRSFAPLATFCERHEADQRKEFRIQNGKWCLEQHNLSRGVKLFYLTTTPGLTCITNTVVT